MTDRPILFSAPMVRALLAGTKTQTRRVFKLPTKGIYERKDMGGWAATTLGGGGSFTIGRDGTRNPAPETVGIWHQTTGTCVNAPYQVGDRLYVREAWQTGSGPNGPQISFRATPDFFDIDAWDGPDEGIGPSFNYDRCPCAHFHHWLPDVLSNDGPWRTPLHMPRWASRLTLTVTDVRVQRLQEISAEDARDEGVDRRSRKVRQISLFGADQAEREQIYLQACRWEYEELWNNLNEARGFGWDANPWVVAVSFSAVGANIDAGAP